MKLLYKGKQIWGAVTNAFNVRYKNSTVGDELDKLETVAPVKAITVSQGYYSDVSLSIEQGALNFSVRNGVCRLSGYIYCHTAASTWVTVGHIANPYRPSSPIFVPTYDWVGNHMDAAIRPNGEIQCRAGTAVGAGYYINVTW